MEKYINLDHDYIFVSHQSDFEDKQLLSYKIYEMPNFIVFNKLVANAADWLILDLFLYFTFLLLLYLKMPIKTFIGYETTLTCFFLNYVDDMLKIKNFFVVAQSIEYQHYLLNVKCQQGIQQCVCSNRQNFETTESYSSVRCRWMEDFFSLLTD